MSARWVMLQLAAYTLAVAKFSYDPLTQLSEGTPPVAVIPRVVFKTGRYPSEGQFPSLLRDLFKANRAQNPGHAFVYVNDSALGDAVRRHLGRDARLQFASLLPGAYRADVGRLLLLWLHGGIYSDLPQTYALPLERIVDHNRRYHLFTRDRPTEPFAAVVQRLITGGKAAAAAAAAVDEVASAGETTAAAAAVWEPVAEAPPLHGLQTSFMACPPRSPLLRHVLLAVLAQVGRRDYGANPLDVTGPAAVYRHVTAFTGLRGDPREWGPQQQWEQQQRRRRWQQREQQQEQAPGSSSSSWRRGGGVSIHIGLEHVSDASGTRLVALPSRRDEGHRHGHLNGTDLVYCFGPAKSKYEKNKMVYSSKGAVKREHYDHLWKNRKVFLGG